MQNGTDNATDHASSSLPETADKHGFSPDRLRLSQDFAEAAGVRRLLTTVPIRRPNRQEFVRVHGSAEFRLETAVLELKEDRETYLVDPSLWPELAGELTPKVLFTTINRQGVLTLWPVRLPQPDGRLDAWNASALDAASLAQERWVRVAANLNLGAYEIYEATGSIPEPTWPDLQFDEILRVGFRGRYITELDHPAIRRLQGY